jgi:phenylacetate-CoA ligase
MLNGYRPTDRVLSYTSPARLNEGRSPLRHLGLLRRRAVDFTLAPAAGADALLDYRPDVIYGNRTSLALVAEELIERGVSPPPLKLVVATGEIIDEPFRRSCREAFGTGVMETYGSVEMGVMAYQRGELEGLHLIEDCTFFEFLDDKGNPVGPGQPARVVVTDLFGRLMPLIRYDQGDRVVYSLRPGPDGHPVRVIDRIIGRQDDLATLADGKVLTWLDFYQARQLLAEAKRFRITQRAVDDFLVEIVTSREHLQMIEAELRTRLGKLSQLPLRFELRIVDRIDPDSSGKMRLLVSEVPRSSPGR